MSRYYRYRARRKRKKRSILLLQCLEYRMLYRLCILRHMLELADHPTFSNESQQEQKWINKNTISFAVFLHV